MFPKSLAVGHNTPGFSRLRAHTANVGRLQLQVCPERISKILELAGPKTEPPGAILTKRSRRSPSSRKALEGGRHHPLVGLQKARRPDVSQRVKNGQVDIAGVRLVQKRTSRVPKHGPPGYTSCDGGMIRQSFW